MTYPQDICPRHLLVDMCIVFSPYSFPRYLWSNSQRNVVFQSIDIFEDLKCLEYTKDWNINVKVMSEEMDKEIQMNFDENHCSLREEKNPFK